VDYDDAVMQSNFDPQASDVTSGFSLVYHFLRRL
jgi:hypothetical protein